MPVIEGSLSCHVAGGGAAACAQGCRPTWHSPARHRAAQQQPRTPLRKAALADSILRGDKIFVPDADFQVLVLSLLASTAAIKLPRYCERIQRVVLPRAPGSRSAMSAPTYRREQPAITAVRNAKRVLLFVESSGSLNGPPPQPNAALRISSMLCESCTACSYGSCIS